MTNVPEEKISTRRGRPRSREAETAILESAYRLLARESAASTTIDAIARESGVSKMTVYKWWPSREALLIDAFLRQASLMLPLPARGEPLKILRAHATAYAEALQTDFGNVQLAVIAECISRHGSARDFSERYLKIRRDKAIKLIKAGQKDGSIDDAEPASDLYDRLYGTLFYQSTFGLRSLPAIYVRHLVDSVLMRRP